MVGTKAFSGNALPQPVTGNRKSALRILTADDQLLGFINAIIGAGNYELPDVAAGAGNSNKTLLFGSGSTTTMSNLVRAATDFNIAADGTSGQVLSTDAAGNLSFVNNTATATPVVLTANTTVAGNSYNIIDVSGGTFTVTLPASPTTSMQSIRLYPGATKYETTSWTLARNGNKIEGDAADMTMDVTNPVEVYYSGATDGYKLIVFGGDVR